MSESLYPKDHLLSAATRLSDAERELQELRTALTLERAARQALEIDLTALELDFAARADDWHKTLTHQATRIRDLEDLLDVERE